MGRLAGEEEVEEVAVVFLAATAGRDGVRAAVVVVVVEEVDAGREKNARRLAACGTSVRTARGADIFGRESDCGGEGETAIRSGRRGRGDGCVVDKSVFWRLFRGQELLEWLAKDWHRFAGGSPRCAASYSVKGSTRERLHQNWTSPFTGIYRHVLWVNL